MMSINALGEFGLIQRLTQGLGSAEDVIQGIGDDCAVLRVGGETLLLSCDASVEEVHFSRAYLTPAEIGWRCAASAISDIAAMGGTPRFLLVSLALPPETETEFAEGMYRGLSDAADGAGAVIIGGDTTRSPGGVYVDVTVVGVATGRAVMREGARAGDLLAVTGWPGQSAAGRQSLAQEWGRRGVEEAHRKPQPRVAGGQWLAAKANVHAMIDVSDGVAQDAGHLAERSGLAAAIDTAQLPVSEALAAAERAHGISAQDCVLGGGEDYELLVALAPEEAAWFCRDFEAAHGLPLTIIGEFSAGIGVSVDGEALGAKGFDHFRTA